EHPVFRRRKWFQGRPIMGERADDIEWFTPEGATMTEDDWKVSYARSIAVFLNGQAIRGLGNRGQTVVDESFYAVFNAYQEPMEFVLPDGPYAERWVTVIDTSQDDVGRAFPATGPEVDAKDRVTVQGRSVVVLRAMGPVT
ncbi:MAG: glycogen debranching protein GlgX, partial [Acidimicrobiales bacterium]